ncbi:methionine aminopeptidase 1D, mitochondrial [Eurytemora carolleeae]|uniref:methionine aminopeptidase 1D, mitochondrial n=1 Tax=Eurytemora carolleeae TaxID=1294199 RepID=UPI000C78B75D|nr:methionine aminopeptidase 1D, mitochondrial [Eurytemora carolleeae]|eukprot:XP_023339398.1 methionine aminopeptidase 1D, mitochondrial-like [Eurytemora affinis]
MKPMCYIHNFILNPLFNPSHIPEGIVPPPYYATGDPGSAPSTPEIKDETSIQAMRRSCKLARQILDKCGQLVRPGLTTDEIDKFVMEESFKAGCYPSPLNYRNFPKAVCTSVNNCVCHGVPDSRPLEDGDIINIDITVFKDGFHGDCSETYLVGIVDQSGVELLDISRQCLYTGIQQCGPGKPFSGIGKAVENLLYGTRFRVVPAFTGHGIGRYFHGPPDIYHCRNRYPGVMKPGMVFTVEPAISEGSDKIYILEDEWTAITTDGSRSAQFEHTILITETGVEILTVGPEQEKET